MTDKLLHHRVMKMFCAIHFDFVSRSSSLAKTILQGTVKGGRRQGRQRRGGETTSGNGQAWSSAGPRGQWKTGENGENWLQNYLWCPNDPRGQGIDDYEDFIPLDEQQSREIWTILLFIQYSFDIPLCLCLVDSCHQWKLMISDLELVKLHTLV